MSADTERLFVQLEARVADFERKMAQAERRGTWTYNQLQSRSRTATRRMETDMARATGRINTALASTTASVGALNGALARVGLPLIGLAGLEALRRGAVAAVSELSEMGKAARAASLDVEDLQGLIRGFERSTRVSGDQLTTAFVQFNRRVGEAINGTGELKRVVDIYRLSLRNANGDLRSQREILGDIADLIRRAPNDQARGQIAQAAFGRVGPELADALRGGSVALDRMIADARTAGDVLDRDLIQRAEILDDRFDALTRRVGTFFKALAVGVTGGSVETPLDTLTRLFGSIERAQAALGADLFEALTRDLAAFDQAADAVERTAMSADELRASVRAALAEMDLLTSELLNLGDMDLAQAVLGLSDELLDAQIAFQNGELSARDFEDAVRDSATRATELLSEVEAVDSASLAGIVARFGALAASIVNATAAVRDLKAEAGLGDNRSSLSIREGAIAESGAQRAAVRSFIAEEERLAARTREQIDLERELGDVQSRARAQGIELTNEQAAAQARANLALKEAAGDGAAAARGGGGGGTGRPVDFTRAVEAIRNRTQSLELEAMALAASAAAGRDYRDAISIAYEESRLLQAAMQAGIPLTDELRNSVRALAAGYTDAANAIDNAADRMRETEDQMRRVEEAARGAFVGFVTGAKSANEAASQLLRTLGEMLLNKAFTSLFGKFFEPGGALAGILGFERGGFTGHGAKHEPAGVVHRGEYVFSKKATDAIGVGQLEWLHRTAKGYAAGGLVTAAPNSPAAPAPAAPAAAVAPAVNLKAVNVFNPADVLKEALATVEGERVILNFMTRNSRKIGGALS